MKPPIHSVKHYVQITRSQVLTVARNVEPLASALNVSDVNLVDEVQEGSLIKAVYVELWILNEGNAGSDVVVLIKSPSGVSAPNFTEMNSLGTFLNKKNILFTHQGLSNNDGIDPPQMIMRAWYKIPKSKQRFGLGDKLHLVISNSGANAAQYCGFATYKEYT